MTNAPESPTKAIPSHQAGGSPQEAWSAHLLICAHKAQQAGFTHYAHALLFLYQLEVQRGRAITKT